MVLVHGFGANIDRATTDIDFAINVSSWDQFEALRDCLSTNGYQADGHKLHRFVRIDEQGRPWQVDVLPFGKIADVDHQIYWPPEQHFVMSVLGFEEAYQAAWRVKVSEDPELLVSVASPAGLCVLKLVSWLGREVRLRAKDARDFEYLIGNYHYVPEILDALYEQGHMEAHDWDQTQASAGKLGEDVAQIVSAATMRYLRSQLLNNIEKKNRFLSDMSGNGGRDLGQSAQWFDVFVRALEHSVGSG